MSEKTDNKIPNVPNLRFNDDGSNWNLIKIKTLLKFQNGLNECQEKYGKGIKYISVSDILNNDYIIYDRIKGLVDINNQTLDNFSVEYGDILFQRSSETIEDIGRSNVYLDKEKKSAFGGFVIRGKKIGDYNPIFFKYLLDTPTARKNIIKMGAGAQHYNISQDGLERISLYFPIMKIQNQIATFLSKIDDRINTQNKIINDLKSQMNWFIDNIIDISSPQFKFKNLYTVAGEGGTPSTSNNLFYENGNIPFIKIEDLSNKYLKFNKDFITEQGLKNSSAWMIPANSIIFSNGATIGRISINMYPVTTKQGILGIIPSKVVLTEYLYYFMRSKYFRKQVHRITVKGTMDCAYLKDLSSINCYIPCLDKQKAIVKMFNLLDEKITIEQTILNKLKEQKKFLLSNMFI